MVRTTVGNLIATAQQSAEALEAAFDYLDQTHPGVLLENPDLLEAYQDIRASLGCMDRLDLVSQINVSYRALDVIQQYRDLCSAIQARKADLVTVH